MKRKEFGFFSGITAVCVAFSFPAQGSDSTVGTGAQGFVPVLVSGTSKSSVTESAAPGKTQVSDANFVDGLDTADLGERFSTEGYAGVYFASLQSSVPSLGVTASIFLDDDFRTGVDIWRGQSKGFFSSFKTQGAGLWAAWEMAEPFWLKGGFSYGRIDRPTSAEPLAVMTGSDKDADRRPVRTDSVQMDLSFTQLFSFSKFSLSVDYVGFSLPFMTLTGPKQSLFNLHALRVDALYDIE